MPTALSTSVRSEWRNVAPTKKITRLSELLDHQLDTDVYGTRVNRFIKSTSGVTTLSDRLEVSFSLSLSFPTYDLAMRRGETMLV